MTDKNIEPNLNVFVQIKGAFFLAGELSLQNQGPDFFASFNYDKDYLELAGSGQAFALDPINLPLKSQPFTTTSRYYLIGAIFDAAPDAWGRYVMASSVGVAPESLTEKEILIKGKGNGVGAIVFTPKKIVKPILDLNLPSFSDIDSIYKVINDIESGININDDLRSYLVSSWDIGGARPKTIVVDEDENQWIVKYPKNTDSYSRERVEWANLEMARLAGMNVPETNLFELHGGKAALAIKRFDRQKSNRTHFLSAVSLISPEPNFDKRQLDTKYGASIFSYARISHVVRTVGLNIGKDLTELYARMILNILVGNTDDHLKNTGFLMDEKQYNKFHLSPLYDVVTQENHLKHMVHIGPKEGRQASIENALSGARLMGIKESAAKDIVDIVSDAVSKRVSFYKQAQMNQEDIDSVSQWLNKDAPKANFQLSKDRP